MKRAVVLGGGGFIGNHLITRLKKEGYWVRGVDIKFPEFTKTASDSFVKYDLRDSRNINSLFEVNGKKCINEVYQLAADMGGATYINAGHHDAEVVSNSVLINANVAKACKRSEIETLFFSSSACVYNENNQTDPDNPICTEDSVYPAFPDSEYGWEKLFSERMFMAFGKNYGINIKIARFHNIYGTLCTWSGGKEKAPAAICRKVITSKNNEIEIIGDGKQTRSFLYIDDCLDAVRLLMNSNVTDPVNIGSTTLISINDFVKLISNIAGKNLKIKNIEGPVGVRGRVSDNTKIENLLGWKPKYELNEGITKTYKWIEKQLSL